LYGCKNRAGWEGAVKGRAVKGSAVQREAPLTALGPRQNPAIQMWSPGTIEQWLRECACL